MKVDEYVREYTSRKPIRFSEVLEECREFLAEVFKFNKAGMKEEVQDVFHFFQLWLWWKFGLNGKLWKITAGSVQKFMNRRKVWREIYLYVGLPEDISNYNGNYKRINKVIGHLSSFGIREEKAREAYEKIVEQKL